MTMVTAFNGKSLDGKKNVLCVAAKRSYTFGPRATRLADQQQPLVESPDIATDEHGRYDWLRDDCDCVPPKVATDVVISGHAEPPARTTEHLVSVRVGRATRTVLALGARRAAVLRGGGVEFTSPEPFERVEISWQLAYGGYDAHAHDELDPPRRRHGRRIDRGARDEGVFSYPRNKVGRGYFIDVDRDRVDGVALPQIEDPEDRLTPRRLFADAPTRWLGMPMSAGLGWVAHTWYPRVARLIGGFLEADASQTPRERSFEDGRDLTGEYRKNELLPRGLQGAAPGLSPARLQGGETVVLDGFCAREPQIAFDLPREVPRLLVQLPGLKEVFEPEPVMQTVRLDLERRLLSIVWCGTVRTLTQLPPNILSDVRAGASWR